MTINRYERGSLPNESHSEILKFLNCQFKSDKLLMNH